MNAPSESATGREPRTSQGSLSSQARETSHGWTSIPYVPPVRQRSYSLLEMFMLELGRNEAALRQRWDRTLGVTPNE